MTEQDLKQIKNIIFVVGGLFAAVVGMYFSKTGFGFEIKGMEWVGYGLGGLCFIVQIAFSSQLAYRSYNWVIFLCGILAYIYSGWSNYAGIIGLNPGAHPAFAFLLGEFIDWVAEPLIVFGLIGVSDSAEGDFLRNLFGRKYVNRSGQSAAIHQPSFASKQDNKPQPQQYTRPKPAMPTRPERPATNYTPQSRRPEFTPKDYDHNIYDK